MKRFSKLISIILVVISAFCLCFSMTGCGSDIVTMEVTVSVYNTSSSKVKDETLTVSLYRHFAKNTVNTIIDYANAGYYDGAIFYLDENYSSQLMLGDLTFNNTTKLLDQKLDNGNLKKTMSGEFAKNNVPGSTLTNVEGAIGLWRSFKDNNYSVTDNSRDSGRATWYMPTGSISTYDSWFCIFAQIDLTDETNKTTWADIKALFNDSTYYKEVVVYYTGEYNADDNVLNNGLTYHCISIEDYEADQENIDDIAFKAEKNQYSNYNLTKIKVPITTSNKTEQKCGAVIKSVVVK